MKKLLIPCALLFSVLALVYGLFALYGTGPAQVTRIIDGDTIQVEWMWRAERVRLIGIDADELRGGSEASRARARAATVQLSEIIPVGLTVTLERDALSANRDRYGRLLRHVITPDGRNVAIEMLRSGHARVLTRWKFERMEEFKEAATK